MKGQSPSNRPPGWTQSGPATRSAARMGMDQVMGERVSTSETQLSRESSGVVSRRGMLDRQGCIRPDDRLDGGWDVVVINRWFIL